MAVTYGFFNSVNGDRKYDADQMTEFFRGIVNEGVFQHLDGGLAVTAGTGLAVNVAAGRAIIQRRWVQNSAALPLTIAAASETYGRKDAVVIRYNISARSVSITVKTGTPAASPAAPSLTRNSTTYEMALAYVNVSAGATSVTVTDKRSDTTVCGWATVAQQTSGEVDAQLNALKTGFDGVVYNSPAEMVQGEDQKLHDELYALVGAQTEVKHELLTTTTPLGTYGSAVANEYIWIAKDIPIPKGSIGKVGVITVPVVERDYKLFVLKKNSETNYTIISTYAGTSKASVTIDYYTIYATTDDLYIGLYSENGSIVFSSNDVSANDNLVRNTYQSFIDGDGTSDVSDVAAPLNFGFELSITKSNIEVEPSFPVVIVDQNGNGDYTTIQAAVNDTQDGDTILIMPGTYFEQVKMWGKNRHLVGLSKENTIIASTNRYYNNEPLQANIGSVTNLTIIGGYGLTPIEGDESSTSYAIHIEYANSSAFEFVVDNCNIISNVAPAIGMGVRYNQTVKIKNSLLQTKASQMWSSSYSEFFNIGGIFCHNDATGTNLGTDGRLEVTDCELKGVITALTLQSQNNGNTLTVRFVNDLLWSTENGKTNAVTIRTTPTEGHIAGSDVILDAMSFGNNIDTLNAS